MTIHNISRMKMEIKNQANRGEKCSPWEFIMHFFLCEKLLYSVNRSIHMQIHLLPISICACFGHFYAFFLSFISICMWFSMVKNKKLWIWIRWNVDVLSSRFNGLLRYVLFSFFFFVLFFFFRHWNILYIALRSKLNLF